MTSGTCIFYKIYMHNINWLISKIKKKKLIIWKNERKISITPNLMKLKIKYFHCLTSHSQEKKKSHSWQYQINIAFPDEKRKPTDIPKFPTFNYPLSINHIPSECGKFLVKYIIRWLCDILQSHALWPRSLTTHLTFTRIKFLKLGIDL